MENTEEITHQFYDTHAHEFSATRYKTWPKIKNFLETTNGLLLDAGCGNGRNMVQDSIGVDFSFNLLQEAYAKNPQNDFIQSNILKLPFCDSVFDRILSIAVVHHLNTHERRLMALSELHRVLKSDGQLLIYVWDKNAATNKKFKCIGNNDYLVDWRNTGHMRYYHMYTLDSFTEFLQATNFRILEIGVEQESLYAKLQK